MFSTVATINYKIKLNLSIAIASTLRLLSPKIAVLHIILEAGGGPIVARAENLHQLFIQ